MPAWLALAALTGCGVGVNESGQTGSPEGGAPPYQSPPPIESGGEIVEPPLPNGGKGAPYIVPRETRARAKVVGDTLITAEGRWLSLVDVSAARAPAPRAQVEFEGEVTLLAAERLDRVVILVTAPERYTGSEVPERLLSHARRRLVEVDASNPASPILGRSGELADDVASVAPTPTGYTLLGGEIDFEEAGCGEEPSLPSALAPSVQALWLQRLEPNGDAFQLGARRPLSAGHFQIASDGAHVVRVGTAFTPPEGDFDLELLDLETLTTTFAARVPLSELGTLSPSTGPSPVFVDHRDGVVLLSGWPRLLAWDTRAGLVLPALATANAPLTFLDDDLASSAHGLARVDRSTAPATLTWIPAPMSPSTTGWGLTRLEPFGDGFVSIASTAAPNDARLVVTRYALADGARLELVEQLLPGWPLHTDAVYGSRWGTDAGSAVLSFSVPIDDSPSARIGVVALRDGQLAASPLVTVDERPLAPLILDGALLSVSEQHVRTLSFDVSTEGVTLTPGARLRVALTNVMTETQHAGLTFAIQRADSGEKWLSVRSHDLSTVAFPELPNVPDAVVPVDDHHVAVFGLSVPGHCASVPDASGCRPGARNGASLLRVEGATATLAASIPLDDLGAAAPSGVLRSLDFSGFFRASATHFGVVGRVLTECSTVAGCQAIGVEPALAPEPYGASSETLLYSLDLSDPTQPSLPETSRIAERLRFSEVAPRDLGPFIVEAWDGSARAFAVEEELYDADGGSIPDGHGRSLNRYAMRFLLEDDAGIRFGNELTIPGTLVALASRDRAFSLEARYRADGAPFVLLHALTIAEGEARIEKSIDAGGLVRGFRAAGDRLALLRAPADVCAPESTYELTVAHLGSRALTLSAPLVLANPVQGTGWAFAADAPALNEPGRVALEGGPGLGRGRLVVDATRDPPAVVRYETVER